ncbi:hypothetical protein ACI2L1_07835 [Streptomyces sp. NPDC019531]|uniref:hypothetical protein n=1 Tax=Streptomyces sp. NPDC019531 TaxID=3365062 RepID=UPI00384D5E6E
MSAVAATPAIVPKGLTRTVLRLHRPALIVWAVFVLGSVGYLVWLTEVTADSVHAAQAACPRNSGSLCALAQWHGYSNAMGWISTFMYYSFWAVAAWSGGALIGRELESGTARLAWTQSVTPTRWLAVKLAVPAVLIVLGGALFVPAYRWAWSAHRDLMGDNWSFPDVFAVRGPAVVAYGLCALAVGALAGLVIRRSLPALGVAVAAMIVLNRSIERHREDFWPTVGNAKPSADLWQTRGGTYHSPSQFWPMHLVETGIVLAAAALTTTTAFWLLRRRTA